MFAVALRVWMRTTRSRRRSERQFSAPTRGVDHKKHLTTRLLSTSHAAAWRFFPLALAPLAAAHVGGGGGGGDGGEWTSGDRCARLRAASRATRRHLRHLQVSAHKSPVARPVIIMRLNKSHAGEAVMGEKKNCARSLSIAAARSSVIKKRAA